MPTFTVKFAIRLEQFHGINRYPYGLVFHRWVPDGRRDSISLPVHTTDATLEVWFERRLATQRGFLKYDRDSRGANLRLMGKQGSVDSGPLAGELRLTGLAMRDIQPLLGQDDSAVHGERRCPTYERLGKQVVRLIQPPVTQFLEALRSYYGQYWIEVLEPWDSRHHSLGSYCYDILNASWRLDGHRRWKPFVPSERLQIMMDNMLRRVGPGSPYLENLTRADWKSLADFMTQGLKPSASTELN